MTRNTQNIARRGEEIVHKLLRNSIWLNEKGESNAPFDINWENVKINVKTTEKYRDENGGTCSFSTHNPNNDVILVFVALIKDKEFFWARNSTNKLGITLKLADSVSREYLINQILEATHNITDIKDKVKRVSVVINKESYKKLRAILILENRSVSEWVRIIVEDFLRKKEEEKEKEKNV